MKKLLFTIVLLTLVNSPCYVFAAPPSRAYVYTTGNIIESSEVTANEDGIFNYLSAGIDTILDNTIVNADINSAAAISSSKLSLGTISQNVKVENANTDHGLYVKQDGALASGKHGLYVYSNGEQDAATLAYIHLDNSSSDYHAAEIVNDGTRSGLIIAQNGALATSNAGLIVTSGAEQLLGAAVSMQHNSVTTTTPVLDLYHGGDGAHLYLRGDPTNSTPIDGEIWFNGTNLKMRIGSTTYNIDMTGE